MVVNAWHVLYRHNDIVLRLRLNFLAQQYWFAIETYFFSQNNLIAIKVNFLSQIINSLIELSCNLIQDHLILIWGLYNLSF